MAAAMSRRLPCILRHDSELLSVVDKPRRRGDGRVDMWPRRRLPAAVLTSYVSVRAAMFGFDMDSMRATSVHVNRIIRLFSG